VSRKQNIMQTCPSGSFSYTIKSGDTLFLLAQRYNTTVEAIMRINPGINPNNLQIGQMICIPSAVGVPTPPTPSVPTLPPCTNGFYYTIRAGDTLFLLSQQFGVSVEAIMRANPGINPNNLQIGQTICIPRAITPTPPIPACPNGFYYSIRPGDTYFGISRQFGVSIDALIRANPGVNPDNLQVGQIICVPSF